MSKTLALIGALLLVGCASAPQTTSVLVPTPIPCPAATAEREDAPARTLTLDPSQPGAAVQAVVANRIRWIGYADALAARLEACK